MQKYKQKPIHFISVDHNQKYKVSQEALSIISSITGKIAIITVAGMYRTGKSYLLNRMLLNRSDGFGVGPTINPCTKGLWIWGKPIIHRNSNDQIINILIMDSQGLGALDEDNNHDAKIFSLTLLLSSCFIYNSMGSIDENAINNLGLVVNLSKFLKIRANQNNSTQNESNQYFPDFFWVVRDFSLQLVNKQGISISNKQYLENTLNQTQKNNQYTQNRNQIRKAIKKYFPKRDCITLVRPLTNEQNLQILEKLEFNSLRPEFIEQVLNFRKSIFTNIKAKIINKKHVNGKIFCGLVNSYISAINNGGIPVIETTWKYICRQQCEKAFEQALMYLQNKSIQKIKKKIPVTGVQFKKLKKQIINQIKQYYIKLTPNNEQRQGYEKILEQKIKQRINSLKNQNEIENMKGSQNFLNTQFMYIDKKIKGNQYKKIGEFIKQIQLFYQYYKKKCLHQEGKSNIYVLEFLLKKFTETSLIISKNNNQQIESLKNNLKQIQVKFQKQRETTNERYLRQRGELIQKINDLDRYRTQISQKYEQKCQQCYNLKQQVNKILNQKQSFQNNLKKQTNKLINQYKININNLQILKQQKQKQYSQLMSRFQTDEVLLKNKIQYYQKNIQQLNSKIKQYQLNQKNVKNQHQKYIRDIQNKFDNHKNQLQIKIMNLENILQQKNNQLKSLQNRLEQISQKKHQLQVYIKNYKDETSNNLNKLKQQLKYSKQQQIQKIRKQLQQNITQLEKKCKKIQSQLNGKQSNLKILKLEAEKQQALLKQKIQFSYSELQQKDKKIQKFNEQYINLMTIIQNKDMEIHKLEGKMIQIKQNQSKQARKVQIQNQNLYQSIQQYTLRLQQIGKLYEQEKSRGKQIQRQKINLQKNQVKLIEQIKIFQSNRNQIILERQLKYQQQIKKMEEQFDNQKQENRQRIQQIKKNSQISLIQLKNFYQIQKQRLQKKVLQQRKKLEHIENQTLIHLEQDHKKYKQLSQNQINRLRDQIKNINTKNKNLQFDYQKKIQNYKLKYEEIEKQKIIIQQILQKKDVSSRQDLKKIQKQFEDQRISFIRKIQTITSQMSKKQKEILQLNTKKQNLEILVNKKQQLIQAINKQNNQQIRKMEQSNQSIKMKFIKCQNQYMQLKIESEKQLALTKQKNQFLTNKIAQLVKQRQINSSKNLMERPNDKNQLMKQQIQKLMTQNNLLQSKFQKVKKTLRQSQNNNNKQISQLQKQRISMIEKLSNNQQKIRQLELKLKVKSEQFLRDLQQTREKNIGEKNNLMIQLQKYKSLLKLKQNQKNDIESKANRDQALLQQKIKFYDYQKQQLKKQLQQNRRKLQFTMNQFYKNRKNDDNQDQNVKNSFNIQKKYSAQIQNLKQSAKRKNEQYQQIVSRLKNQIRNLAEKNKEFQDKIIKNQKNKKMDDMLLSQIQQLKKQRDQYFLAHKAELAKQNQECRRKIAQVQKKYKTIQKKNAQFNFYYQKQHAKWMMQRDSLIDQINQKQQLLLEKSNMEKSMDQRSMNDLKKSLMSDKQKRRNTLQDTYQIKKTFQFDFAKK